MIWLINVDNGGTINGIVLAANGKPVSNAAVACHTSAGNKPRAAHTDAQGRFTIPGLRQDSYDLRASANGAYSDWERLVSLHHGETKSVTLYLLNGNDTPSGMRPAARKQKP